ncbi:extracellular matrix protein 3-like isoform X2 [Acanthaster planci]|uniref:Extracellular matrix protein 3-like isoform X2 n=1 Tax=Acanthaster planci TaxID=133434 RepID=A0A8B7Y4B2_ACAPL|nr:extracellular matrix protein 3-like isoform X2 [Acanthaster planci]
MIISRVSLSPLVAVFVALFSTVVYCQSTASYNLTQTSYTVREGDTHVIIAINRRGNISVPTSILVTTVSGTAISPGDFTPLNQRREFIENSLVLTVRIVITDDNIQEGDESFRVQISNPSDGGTIGSGSQAEITIQDNDAQFSFESNLYPAVSEAQNSITVAVVRNGYSNREANVYVSTMNRDPNNPNSATPDGDFVRLVETRLQFLPGVNRVEVPVTILSDQIPENTETLVMQIVRVVDGLVGSPSRATLSISDDDVQYEILEESYSVKESTGLTQITVTITKKFNLLEASSIQVYTEDGTATAAGRDYATFFSRVGFAMNQASATAIINILDDNVYEPVPEVFYVGIRDPQPSGFVLTSASRRPITIEDNESILSIVNSTYTVSESDRSVTVQVRRTGDLSQQSSVRARSVAVSATADQDYTPFDLELMFPVNRQGVDLRIAINEDDVTGEGDEVFIVELYNAAVSVLDAEASSARITIQDSPRLSTLAIVLIAVGCSIFVILILIMILCCCAFMRPNEPKEPFSYDRGLRGAPVLDIPREALGRGPVVTYYPDDLDDRGRYRLDRPSRRSDRRNNGSVVQNGGPRITEIDEIEQEPRRESNRHASSDQPPPPPPPEERLPEGREPEDRFDEPSDPRRSRSMFNPRAEREPYWGKARQSYHSSPNHYGYF